jgi:protein tyrosine phosphatase
MGWVCALIFTCWFRRWSGKSRVNSCGACVKFCVLLDQCSHWLRSRVPSLLLYKHLSVTCICGSHSFAFLPYDSHSKVVALAQKLVRDIAEGQVIYLHCWGGHGRTGTVVCIMLHLLYGVSARLLWVWMW